MQYSLHYKLYFIKIIRETSFILLVQDIIYIEKNHMKISRTKLKEMESKHLNNHFVRILNGEKRSEFPTNFVLRSFRRQNFIISHVSSHFTFPSVINIRAEGRGSTPYLFERITRYKLTAIVHERVSSRHDIDL